MAIVWGMPPPVKTCSSSIRLLCIKAGQSFDMAILGPTVGLQTHWTGTKTVPCMGVDCAFHDEPQTWKGYCAVLVANWYKDQPAQGYFQWVLVVTEEIGQTMLAAKRGQIMKVSRPGRKSNGPLVAENRSGKFPGDLPPSFDPKPYVLRACGFTREAAFTLRTAGGTNGR